jgi:hypothetical protein
LSLITASGPAQDRVTAARPAGQGRWSKAVEQPVIVAAVLAVFLVIAAVGGRQPQIRASLADRDSIAYWAAGRLLLARENPYDAERVLALQRAQGYRGQKPLVLRTPPWSLWMIAWMGLLNPYWAWATWIAVLMLSLVISIRIAWKMYGSAGRPPTVFLLVAYLFAPVPACLVAGQLGIVLLLGIALFLWWQERRPALAGVVLLAPFAKPHLLAVFWPVLAVWIFTRRKWSMLAGFATAVPAAVALSLAIDPAVFSQYQHMLAQATIQDEFIPAVSGVVRLIFFRDFFWVQFLPAMVALVWSGWYFQRHRTGWDWRKHGPALLVVSVLTAPYAWMTDEAILLPAMLQAVACVYVSRKKLAIRSQLVMFLFACLNLLLLILLRAKIPFATGIYFWSSMAWAAWYWYAQR